MAVAAPCSWSDPSASSYPPLPSPQPSPTGRMHAITAGTTAGLPLRSSSGSLTLRRSPRCSHWPGRSRPRTESRARATAGTRACTQLAHTGPAPAVQQSRGRLLPRLCAPLASQRSPVLVCQHADAYFWRIEMEPE
eukprot:258860-Rhodomonas_salina.1